MVVDGSRQRRMAAKNGSGGGRRHNFFSLFLSKVFSFFACVLFKTELKWIYSGSPDAAWKRRKILLMASGKNHFSQRSLNASGINLISNDFFSTHSVRVGITCISQCHSRRVRLSIGNSFFSQRLSWCVERASYSRRLLCRHLWLRWKNPNFL